MPNDKTMPPSEQLDAPSSGTGPAPSADMAPSGTEMPPQGGGDGSVMVTMPKAAFDAMHALVAQLASGLDQLKQGVEQQASGAGAPPAEMPPQAPEGGASGGAGSDDEFLKGLAQEGSQK